ncbi:MAG: hypothetical protein ACU0BF_11650 [Paracoccaceae bacterium]
MPSLRRLPATAATRAWAAAAWPHALAAMEGPWRHGGTWLAGVDALGNAADGSVDGTPFPFATLAPDWHRAQISAVRPGYPAEDGSESAAAHRFRRDRCGAHVDGLLPLGPERRRHLVEPHAFVLGLGLTDGADAPLTVWEGSEAIVLAAFRAALHGAATPEAVDLTQTYAAARRRCFAECAPVRVPLARGEGVWMHRAALHGIAPWAGPDGPPRVTAWFRPPAAIAGWLADA